MSRIPIRLLAFATALLAACDSLLSPGADGPARLVVADGDLQPGAIVGEELADPVVVRVLSGGGKPVAGHVVQFAVTAGTGSVFPAEARTNAVGEARTRWTLGTSAGDTQRIVARAGMRHGEPIATTVRAVAGAASPARFFALPLTTHGWVGGALADSLRVGVTDRYDNPVPGVRVSWTVASGGGTLAHDTTRTNARGEATNAWTLGTTAGPQSAQASIHGLPPVLLALMSVPGYAVSLQIQPDAISFSGLGETLELRAIPRDPFGNTLEEGWVRWHSVDSTVVRVIDHGRGWATAVARANGTTRIVATLVTHPAADTAEASVQQRAARIVITPSPLNLNPGNISALSARVLDAASTPVPGATVTWTSSAPGVATVAADGTVHAKAVGSATVTAAVAGATGLVQVNVNPQPPTGRHTMDVGYRHSCALTVAGEAYCWGGNSYGQLGTGMSAAELARSLTPRKVLGGHTFVALAAAGYATCGLTAAGAVYCWGGQQGHTPRLVSGGRAYRSVDIYSGITTDGDWRYFSRDTLEAPGRKFSAVDFCALEVTGNIVCSTGPPEPTPGFARIAVGTRLCGVTFAGRAYCRQPGWVEMQAPVPVAAVTSASHYRQDQQVCAISTAGRIYCGSPVLTALTAAELPAFVDIAGAGVPTLTHPPEPATSHYCVLSAAGDIYCWGTNADGELGNGTTTASPAPVPVAGGLRWATPDNPPPGA